ncbi:MAG: uroporphyrinogen decarboxylase family protein [Clostridia bacterium]
MNARQKFMNVMELKPGAPVPEWEFAYWYDTIQRWYKEGLPKSYPPMRMENHQWVSGEACPGCEKDIHNFFRSDEGVRGVPVYTGPFPVFQEIVYEQDDEHIIYLRGDGKVVKTRTDGCSMPNFLEYPIKNEKDFDEIKERFDPKDPDRFPDNWAMIVKDFSNRDYPLQLGGGNFAGFYSIIRELVGVEESLFLFYDNPGFVTRILDHFLEFYITIYSRVLEEIEVDYILIWEDMAYKGGPLVSPSLFQKYILPYYKDFTAHMRGLGVRHFIVDTDGNFEVLIPLFLEGGVTGFYPFEVQAGMNIEKIREDFPDLVIMGGIDKKALSLGKEAIDGEVAKAERMLAKGGYLPYVDHMVPPDVSFENYCYYRHQMKRVLASNSCRT